MGLQRGSVDYKGYLEQKFDSPGFPVVGGLFGFCGFCCWRPVNQITSRFYTINLTLSRIDLFIAFGGTRAEKGGSYGEAFTRVSMRGSVSVGHSIGRPEVQIAPDQLLIPQGTVVESIDILFDETIEVDAALQGIDLLERPIVPTQPPVPIGYPSPLTLSKDEEAYLSTDRMPGKRYSSLGVGHSHGYSILTLNVYPTQYFPAEGRLFYHPNMAVMVDLRHTGHIDEL